MGVDIGQEEFFKSVRKIKFEGYGKANERSF